MASDIKRPLPDVVYTTAGGTSTLDLPRDHVFKALNLMFNLALATGTTPASGGEPQAGILNAIRRLEIVADGAVTLWSIDPYSLWVANALWNSGPAQRDDLAPPGGSSSSVLQAFLQIPFALPFAKNPVLTLLNASALSSLQLKVTWGSISDLWATIANTTITASGTIIQPETQEIVGLDPRSIYSAFKVSQITKQVTASNNNLETDLPRSNVVKGILIKVATTASGIETEVDNVLNEVRLESSELGRGPFVHRRSRCTDTNGTARKGYHPRNQGRLLYGSNDLVTVETGQQDFDMTGFYPFEFMENMSVAGMIRTQSFSSFKAITDVTVQSNNPYLTFNMFEVIPAAKPAGAA